MPGRLPRRLGPGSHVRVVAPSRSLEVVTATNRDAAEHALETLGYEVSFGQQVMRSGPYSTADVALRINDLHAAFSDPTVDGILSAVGGTRCIDLLHEIDWELVARSDKVLCGYSDLTVLLNAVWARVGLVTYLGPHFSSFAMEDRDGFQTRSFLGAVTATGPVELHAAATWSDSAWFEVGVERDHRPASWTPLRAGRAEGVLVGGNLSSFLALQGTPFAPSLAGAVLLVEEVAACQPAEVRRGLVALSLTPGFADLEGLVLGRFQRGTGLDASGLRELVASLPGRYQQIPILADFDFGHTQPISTLPVGGRARLDVQFPGASVTVLVS